MATIKDIATRLGVSVSTVSKGLNGASDISEELRQMVLDTAVEMGYATKKSKKKDNSLIQVISPYYGNFEEKVVEEESEAILTSANEETEETIENIEESETTETVEDEEEKLPTVEDNLRNIANIVKEEQDQLKIIEERTGEFKLDFGANKDEEKTTLIDEIDDNMSLDELMSLYEKKFKD